MNRQQRRASHSNGKKVMAAQYWSTWEEVPLTSLPSLANNKIGIEKVYKNSRYIVQIFGWISTPWGPFTKVGIRRNDAAAAHSWSEIMRIKNELFSCNAQAIEIFPRASELVDAANMYWIWIGEVPKEFTI